MVWCLLGSLETAQVHQKGGSRTGSDPFAGHLEKERGGTSPMSNGTYLAENRVGAPQTRGCPFVCPVKTSSKGCLQKRNDARLPHGADMQWVAWGNCHATNWTRNPQHAACLCPSGEPLKVVPKGVPRRTAHFGRSNRNRTYSKTNPCWKTLSIQFISKPLSICREAEESCISHGGWVEHHLVMFFQSGHIRNICSRGVTAQKRANPGCSFSRETDRKSFLETIVCSFPD